MKIVIWTLGAAALAGFALLGTPPQAVVGQSVTCEAVTLDGQPRNCTSSEKAGMCLTEALDARDACYEDNADSWWSRRGCDGLFVWDAAVCLGENLPKVL